ncbi:MAG: hypothetical protein HC836_50385, partial [Richelia sp. RM2_1_2]|nr:hypothetical protein [Richelia sp. RM2_1_2]
MSEFVSLYEKTKNEIMNFMINSGYHNSEFEILDSVKLLPRKNLSSFTIDFTKNKPCEILVFSRRNLSNIIEAWKKEGKQVELASEINIEQIASAKLCVTDIPFVAALCGVAGVNSICFGREFNQYE